MKVKRFAGLGLGILLTAFSAQAQTLFTYGGHPVSEEEFLTVYKKNNKDAAAKNTTLSDYLNLYALFRMKVQDALDMKMDTTAAVINELNNYKAQLTRSELVDKAVTDKLVQEAYDRMKKDIKVAHILIAVRPNEDTVRAEKLADSLYLVLKKGEANFATLAERYSDDKTTAPEGGEIGYITALQTPYDFETVAYNTPVGQFSKPFRTMFGYDILKVQDIRPDPGKVQVAQILIASPKYKGAQADENALALADKIETELKHGANFDEMVKQYSDDRYSKDNKGVLQPFGIGEMSPDYEKAAFALKKPGDISAPVKTTYGYHIIRLIRRIPLQPMDSIDFNLTSRVENDSRESKAKSVYLSKIKDQYHFKSFPNNFQQLLTAVKNDKSKEFSPQHFPHLTQPLFEMDGKTYSQADFLAYAHKLLKGDFVANKETVLEDLYSGYQNKMVSELQQKKLFESNPHLRELVQEYKNGILLFDLMDKKVWNKATTDSVGLQNFYQQNKAKYQWQPGFDGSVFYSSNKPALEKLRTFLNEGEDPQMALDKVNQEFKDIININQQTGRYSFNQFPINTNSLQASKASEVFDNTAQTNAYGLVYATKLYPNAAMKSLDDARGFVVADYQDYLEKQWEQQLKEKYPLKINQKELKTLEKRYH